MEIVLKYFGVLTDDDTAFNLPDSLTYEDIGEHVGNGSDKDAYKLKAYPNLLFLYVVLYMFIGV
jgi:hypothetical protein